MLDYGFFGLDTGVVPNVDSVCTRMTSFADIGAAKLNEYIFKKLHFRRNPGGNLFIENVDILKQHCSNKIECSLFRVLTCSTICFS